MNPNSYFNFIQIYAWSGVDRTEYSIEWKQKNHFRNHSLTLEFISLKCWGWSRAPHLPGVASVIHSSLDSSHENADILEETKYERGSYLSQQKEENQNLELPRYSVGREAVFRPHFVVKFSHHQF